MAYGWPSVDRGESVWLAPRSLGQPGQLEPRWRAFMAAIGKRRRVRARYQFSRFIVEGMPDLLLYNRTVQAFCAHGWLESERTDRTMHFDLRVTEDGRQIARRLQRA